MKKEISTTITKNSVFKGNFILTNSIRVEGTVEGEIKTDQDVYISKTGTAKSNIKAKNVHVEGSVVGQILASTSVEISSSGSVKGDIKSQNLKIADGAITYGRVSINESNATKS